MEPNPYTPGQVPRVFAGREREIGLLRDRIGRVVTFGEYGGPVLAFHAPRGVGKTSLLRQGQREAAGQGFVTAWVSGSTSSSLTAEIRAAVGRALAAHEPAVRTGRGTWTARLAELGIEVGLPGVTVAATFDTTDAAGTSGSADRAATAPIGAMEQLLHESASLVREVGGAGLMVCIDEVHAADSADLAVLLNALQNIDGDRERNPLMVAAAGLPSTPEVLTRAATFGERVAYVPLNLLPDADALHAVIQPAVELDVTWAAPAADRVVADAAGYPYFLQLLAHAAWAAARPDTGDSVTEQHVLAGYPDAVEQLRSMYRARWKAATPREQDFLAAMAGAGAEDVPRAMVAEALGVHQRALSVPRDRLIEKGIIEPAGRGLLRFTLPGFTYYVAAEAGLTEAVADAPDYLALLTRDVRDQ